MYKMFKETPNQEGYLSLFIVLQYMILQNSAPELIIRLLQEHVLAMTRLITCPLCLFGEVIDEIHYFSIVNILTRSERYFSHPNFFSTMIGLMYVQWFGEYTSKTSFNLLSTLSKKVMSKFRYVHTEIECIAPHRLQ